MRADGASAKATAGVTTGGADAAQQPQSGKHAWPASQLTSASPSAPPQCSSRIASPYAAQRCAQQASSSKEGRLLLVSWLTPCACCGCAALPAQPQLGHQCCCCWLSLLSLLLLLLLLLLLRVAKWWVAHTHTHGCRAWPTPQHQTPRCSCGVAHDSCHKQLSTSEVNLIHACMHAFIHACCLAALSRALRDRGQMWTHAIAAAEAPQPVHHSQRRWPCATTTGSIRIRNHACVCTTAWRPVSTCTPTMRD